MTKISLKKINSLKKDNKGIASLTAYDASFAKVIDDCGIDIILVGDSLGEVIQGNKNTHSVTLDEIVYHTKIVSKGITRAYLISDMPRHTYQKPKQAIKNTKFPPIEAITFLRGILFSSATVVRTFGQMVEIATSFNLIKPRGPINGVFMILIIPEKSFPPNKE